MTLGDESGRTNRGDDDCESRPTRVDDLVTRYMDRLVDGETLEFDEILIDHPDVGEEVVEHLRSFVELGDDLLQPAAVGTLGDYTLRRQIGRGGMGVVYEAWQNSVDRHVALKVLPPGVAADERSLQRFVREAKTAAQLHHANIVGVHGMGVESDTPYFAMEYVEGETLAQILARIKDAKPETGTPFGKKDCAGYFEQQARVFADVADGLQHAHSKGVVHRDIKPSNLILDSEGRLRILDFGLARLEGQDSLTISGDVVGTPLYMSPEQARRKKIPIDHRTDVYSLGATMYEMLTGRPPFRGRDHAETLSQVIERDPVEPRRINPRVSADLETIVLKCLRKDAGDRYGTAEALGQDLERFVRGEAVEAQPEARSAQLVRWGRRHRTSITVGAIVVFLALLGLASSVVLVARAYQVAAADRDTAVEERDQRTRQLYRVHMRLANQDWKAANFSRFVSLLAGHVPARGEPDLRGWEWYYLKSLERSTRQLEIQADRRGVVAIAWSPDGTSIASGGADGIVRLWDARSGVSVLELPGQGSTVMALAWTSDGTRIAAVTHDGWVNCWSGANGAQLFSHSPRTELAPRCEQRSVAWSPDGSVLVCGSELDIVDVRDGESGAILRTLRGSEGGCVPMVSWSPDGAYVAAAIRLSGHAVIWDVDTWEEVHRIETGRPYLYTVSWSPDGSQLAMSSSSPTIQIWNIRSWEEEGTLNAHEGGVLSLDWAAAGLASSGGDGVARIWDVRTSKVTRKFLGNSDAVWNVRWSPDASRIATAGQDGVVRLWDVVSDPLVEKLERHAGAVWTSQGRAIAAVSPEARSVDIIEATSGDVLQSLEPESPPLTIALHPDGRLVAILLADDVITIWDWVRGVELRRIEGQHGGDLRVAAWSPDGEVLATTGEDGVVRIWNAGSWKLLAELRGHERWVSAVVWRPDGRRLATTSSDLVLKIWDRATWQCTLVLHRGEILPNTGHWTGPQAMAWSPDGELLAASTSWTGDVIAWHVESGTQIFRVAGHVAALASVAWNPDGQRLATGGVDRLVKIWDVSDLEHPAEMLVLEGHERTVITLSWCPDGRQLLSSDPCLSADGLEIYFSSRRDDPASLGNTDLWVAGRTSRSDSFTEVRALSEINTPATDGGPSISTDGNLLVFHSNRPGTLGNHDLWIASRVHSEAPFDDVQNLGPEVNTNLHEFASCLSFDGSTLLFARGDFAMGFSDIYMASRAPGDMNFSTATALRSPVNSSDWDSGNALSAEWPRTGAKIYFGSYRPGGLGSSDIREATWTVVLDDLECSVTDCGGAQLHWSNPNALEYANVSILRDGRTIATLDPEDVDFQDEAAEMGLHDYAVVVAVDGATYELHCDVDVGCSDPVFLRGDTNGDSSVDIADAVHALNWLFGGGTKPPCLAAANINGDEATDGDATTTINIADPIYLLSFLFGGGSPPVAPYPDCGPATLEADDLLGCETPPEACR